MCNRGYNCMLKHAEHSGQRGENPQQQEHPKIKGRNSDKRKIENEYKLEQIVKAVKEEIRSQNNFLSNMQRETNREKQNTLLNQAQHAQIRALMQQAQSPPATYIQNFP